MSGQNKLWRLTCLSLLCRSQLTAFQPPLSVPASLGQFPSTTALDSSLLDRTESVHECLQRGLANMNSVMAPDFFFQSPVLKQFYTKLVKAIEVRESQIPGAGRGLFAKKAIKANTIVSFYPAHALGIDSDRHFVVASPTSSAQQLDGRGDMGVHDIQDDDATYFAKHFSSDSEYLHCTDQPVFGRPSLIADVSNDPLYLDVNPYRPVADGWQSHLINDGATIQRSRLHDSDREGAVLDYYRESKRAKNCIHIPFGPSPIMATVTTRRVAAGDELLTSYGGTYWLGAVSGEHAVEITPAIQAEINESAQDLFRSMKVVSVLYTNQLVALHSAFSEL
jgi:SET domain